MCVCGYEVSLFCVCVYRCVHLKALAVCMCRRITDAGISNVISSCNKLRILNLTGLQSITGMCAVCEDREHALCFITVCCVIFLQQIHH
jgi:bacterioferritin-associated ferredoxin